MAARRIELLSPARDAATGVEAIRHGADAVYIGGPRFGAREAAANAIGDIRRLAEYAHVFGAKVYATLNTILYDSELSEARDTAWQLYEAGADALLVQDAALLRMADGMPPIALHASTQCHNLTPAKIVRLYLEGFTTAVLARELSVDEIAEIHRQCPAMRLEAFVHGALCVSFSGRCYASQHCFGRSANRGECAQFCRLPFDLETKNGQKLLTQKHLLSLRDLNRSAWIERMLDAGVSSLKIEGRLKGPEYVKNITAWYRRRLDAIFARRGEYCRASAGEVRVDFAPAPEKSFNRGFTDYFIGGRTLRQACPATPKSIGEPVGEVREAGAGSITVSGHKSFSNGDGLCFFGGDGRLCGFRVNRAEGTRLFPAAMPAGIRNHTRLFRNHDEAFERRLAKPSAERTLRIDFRLSPAVGGGYLLRGTDELGRSAEAVIDFGRSPARSPQDANISAQLSKLGGTPFRAGEIAVECGGAFIPSSLLAAARRRVVEELLAQAARRPGGTRVAVARPRVSGAVDYSHNVANKEARSFYLECGATEVAPAWEIEEPAGVPIMTCRYCLRHEIGMCLRERGADRSPLFLRLADGRRFALQFDCRECIMRVYAQG